MTHILTTPHQIANYGGGDRISVMSAPWQISLGGIIPAEPRRYDDILSDVYPAITAPDGTVIVKIGLGIS